MTAISVKISPALEHAVGELAKSRGVTRSTVIREALERYLAIDARPVEGSFLALAKDYAGCLEGGPADLSSNAKHLDGYGQ